MNLLFTKEKRRREIILGLSDTHGGSKYGLLCPRTTLHDIGPGGQLVAYKPNPSAWNAYEYKCFDEDLTEAARFADGAPVHVFFVGDMTHGVVHIDGVVSTPIDDQLVIALDHLRELLDRIPNVKSLRIDAGTEVHEFGEGTAAKNVTRFLSAEYPNVDIKMVDHGLATVSGALVDYSHHGPGGGIRVWLRGNNARYYLQDIMMDEILEGKQPPKLVFRGHVHQYINEVVTVKKHESRIVVLPSYCGMNPHARKVTRSTYKVTNGMVLFEVVDGRMSEPIPLMRTIDLRSKEEL